MIPLVRNILINDIADPDGSINAKKLMYTLNTFMSNNKEMLTSGLTFEDNFVGDIKEITFTTEADYTSGNFKILKISVPAVFTVKGVMLLQIINTDKVDTIFLDPTQLSWYQQKTIVNIGYVTGLANSTNYKLRILMI